MISGTKKIKKRKSLEWKNGDRAFYWNEGVSYIDSPLCLQSKQFNGDMKGVTWVYYSKSDAKQLQIFLNKVLDN